MRKKTRKMRKKIAWITNLMNVVILGILVSRGCSPVYGAIACTVALTTTLVATMPEAVNGELRATDTIL
jgi:hypothetical protein